MIIIAGGEPVLRYKYGTALRGMLSKRVGSMYARMRYVVNVSLVQNAVCTCCKKGLV